MIAILWFSDCYMWTDKYSKLTGTFPQWLVIIERKTEMYTTALNAGENISLS